MARPKSLTSMSIDALLKLRDDVTAALGKHASDMKQQLLRLGASAARAGGVAGSGRQRRRRRAGPLKGRKVAPKYRGPGGQTWAGRGARPRWLAAELKRGKRLDDFLIAKPAGKAKRARRRRKAKR